MSDQEKIIYTLTDEAPALATFSLLPLLQSFAAKAGIKMETRDISLAARILSQFPDFLAPEQRQSDALKELGELAQKPEANIIKLPNISASLPQLKAAIKELQGQGFAIPNYPDQPSNEKEQEIKARYDRIKGSAVNPVLREGNSDRRAPKAVKKYAQNHPHRMGAWSADSKSRVSSMSQGDFFESEQSLTMDRNTNASIVFTNKKGEKMVLKKDLALLKGEVIDASFLSAKALDLFIAEQIEVAQQEGVLFSVHLKATMMKVSDPVIFGHFVKAFLKKTLSEHAELLKEYNFNPNNGIKELEQIAEALDEDKRATLLNSLNQELAARPDLAMVDSYKGITNLHMPNDVIIDASMPAMIRNGGQMWNKNDESQDTLAIIPDRSYAGVYQETVDFCKKNGAFDPTTMGSVSNVGLMAQKAEEYGSHDKTFILEEDGSVEVIDEQGKVLLSHAVEAHDIWRLCQVKDEPIKDWVKLAVNRARATGVPAVFWLDKNRAHDAELIKKVNQYLGEYDISQLEMPILSPAEATRFSLERAKKGLDTISVTGNVLRDFLTDLFPILELGTSAKMLSIVPLMNGGGLFETGAGGSAPKHVQQLVAENHLRWDSLGEFLALSASLEHLAKVFGNERAQVLADSLDLANSRYLEENKAPSRKVNEPDNRSSHYYLVKFWAEALSEQSADQELADWAKGIKESLWEHKEAIENELLSVQGQPVDLGGYYHPDFQKASQVMRPSPTLNKIFS